MNVGPSYRREAVLADGTPVVLRPVRPEDRAEIRRQLHRMSPGSRYRRFLTATDDLSDDALRYLTEVDGLDHVAIVATGHSHDLKTDTGLGIARFVRLKDEPDVAEAAVTVVDDAQNKGLGRLLLSVLAEAARERGVRVFRAVILAENAPIRRLLDEAGAIVRTQDGATLELDVPLAPPPAVEAPIEAPRLANDHPLRRLLRMAASSLFAIRINR